MRVVEIFFKARESHRVGGARHDAVDFVPTQLKLADCGLVGLSQPVDHDALEERGEVRIAILPRRVDLHLAVLGALHARNVGDKKCFVLTTIKMSPRASTTVVARACLAASRKTRRAAKLDEHLEGQRRVVHGDLKNKLRLVYAQEFFVKIFVVHVPKLGA